MRTVKFFIDAGAKRFPEKIVSKYGGESCTYRQLKDRSNALASGLVKLGMRKGERAAILAENCHTYLEIIAGMAQGGFTLCTLNNLLHPDELAYILQDSASSVLFFDRKFAPVVKALLPRCKDIRTTIAFGEGDGDELQTLDYDRLITENDPAGPGYDVGEEETLLLIYTSGTTGKPKGVMLTHKNCYSNSQCVVTGLELPQETVNLVIAPMFHVAATNLQTMTTLYLGGTNVIMRKFDIKEVLETIQREKVTFTFFVPTMIYRILDYPTVDRYDLSSLRQIGYGGAPIFVDRLKRAREVFGPILNGLYGLTEATSTLTHLRPEHHTIDGSPGEMRRLNSCGREFALHEIRILDEAGKDIRPGDVGEIVVRSESVMKGYWNNDAATMECIRDGWFHTGDLATFDDDHFVYIVDRKKNMIISGGENVYPKEIEETIIRHPGVKEVLVFGMPDRDWGETPKAVVAPKEGMTVTEEEIIAFCKANLSKYKCPKKVTVIEELPKNSIGKIDIKRIKEEFRER